MGQLTEGMARLVADIQTARREREESMRRRAQAMVAMRGEVARLRSACAADVSGARAAWSPSAARVPVEEQPAAHKSRGRRPAR